MKDFLGIWILDGEKNEYETSNPPKTGEYTISKVKGYEMKFDISWTDTDNNEFKASYITIADGKKYPYENPDIAEFIETVFLSDSILETSSYKSGKLIAKGIRIILEGKKSMLVIQEMYLESGEKLTNKSIYNKKHI